MVRQQFNDNWIFQKLGEETSRLVTIPHDAMLEEKRASENATGSSGAYFGAGTYIYEKELEVPAEWKNKHVELQFEGVYKNSKVYVNDIEVGGAAYGYIPYFVNLDDKVNYGETNIIKVVADNSDIPNSRWYTGAGIYRPVWLWVGEKVHILPEGIRVTTLSYDPVVLRVEVSTSQGAEVEIQICDGDTVEKTVEGARTEFVLPYAKLWSEEVPHLYTCKAVLKKDMCIVDEAETTFGIRFIEWSNKGFFVNGKSTLLRGGCIHHDNGILGAASYKESEFRRVKMLKNAGFNAIRSAHNPIAEATLRACDVYGMYVIDECWDMWYSKKSRYDYANDFLDNYKVDLNALVSRDYNHPSVIMYSIGNEVSEPVTERGVALSKELGNILRKLDEGRPVTAGYNLLIMAASAKGKSLYDAEQGGRNDIREEKTSTMNSTMFNLITSFVGTGMNKASNGKSVDKIVSPAMEALDICGYNYASGRYAVDGKLHPNRIIVGSETFPQDIAKNWKMVKKYPYLIGDFMWTAWDYLGEVGLGAWSYSEDGKNMDKPYPWLLADSGAIDILGNPNGELFLAQAAWDLLDNPQIAVQPANHLGQTLVKGVWRGTNAIPSWSWKNCDGTRTVVEVYTNAAEVELFINEKKVSRKKVKDCKAVFKTKYETGQIRALCYTNGVKVGERILVSAIGTLHVCVTSEKSNVKNGDIVYYDISIKGENDVVESNADRKLTVKVEGGELLGFGSANPRTEECFHTGVYTTYYGKAQAVVRVRNVDNLKINIIE